MGDYCLLKCSVDLLAFFQPLSIPASQNRWSYPHTTNTLKIKTLRSNIASFSQNSDMLDIDSYWFCNSQQRFFSYLLSEPVFNHRLGQVHQTWLIRVPPTTALKQQTLRLLDVTRLIWGYLPTVLVETVLRMTPRRDWYKWKTEQKNTVACGLLSPKC